MSPTAGTRAAGIIHAGGASSGVGGGATAAFVSSVGGAGQATGSGSSRAGRSAPPTRTRARAGRLVVRAFRVVAPFSILRRDRVRRQRPEDLVVPPFILQLELRALF